MRRLQQETSPFAEPRALPSYCPVGTCWKQLEGWCPVPGGELEGTLINTTDATWATKFTDLLEDRMDPLGTRLKTTGGGRL